LQVASGTFSSASSYDGSTVFAHWPPGYRRRLGHTFYMYIGRKFVTLLLFLALLLTEACNKKKPALPPRSIAPTVAEELPAEIPETQESSTPEVAQTPVQPPPVKTKPKKAPKSTAKKTAPPNPTPPAPAPATATNTTTVATLRPPRTGAVEAPPDTAIAAAIPSEEAIRQKERTAQIVESTENSLKNMTRSLNDEEKSMRTQIQSYLQQSKKATSDGDIERAYHLARKAQLLAEALLKE
jgi:hypothetical protein